MGDEMERSRNEGRAPCARFPGEANAHPGVFVKKPCLLLAVVVALVAGISGYFLVKELSRPQFDAAKLGELRRGMTRQKVAGILGRPPGHYPRFWGDGPGPMMTSLTIYPDASQYELWSDNDGYYLVYFDNGGGAVRILDKDCEGQQRRVNRGEKPHTRVLDRVSSD